MSRVSRRSLIKNAGTTAVVGPHIGAMPGAGQMIGKGTDAFDHVVVLMLENRSFDNLLGYLYEAGHVPRGQAFEGIDGKPLSNPIPPNAPDAKRKTVPVHAGSVMDNPNPAPGEEYPHVSTQLFGTVDPEGNRYRSQPRCRRRSTHPIDRLPSHPCTDLWPTTSTISGARRAACRAMTNTASSCSAMRHATCP